MSAALFAPLKTENFISLTTFRKSGEKVATPVWFVEIGDHLYVYTSPTAGKIKRLRHTTKVEIAPCTATGKIMGSTINATAHILGADERVLSEQIERELNKKYGWQRTTLNAMNGVMRFFRRKAETPVSYIEISAE